MPDLVYTIDKPLSEKFRAPTIRVDGVATQKDSEIIALLKSEEAQFPPPKTSGCYRIRPSQILKVLKFVAAKGMIQFEGKFLVCDFFLHAALEYRVVKEEGKLKLHAYLVGKDWEAPLSSCSFIFNGPPTFCIKGNILRILKTTLSDKEIAEYTHPFEIDGEKLQELIEEHQEDEDAPKVVYDPSFLLKHVAESQPKPILVLKDRTGATADLWMDYPGKEKISYHSPILSKSIRNKKAETDWEKDLLETGFQKKLVGTSHYFCPIDKVSKSLTFLLELGWKITDFQGRNVIRQNDFQLTSTEQNNHVLVQGKIRFENYEADLKDVVGVFNRKDKFVVLNNHTIGLLDTSNSDKLTSLADEGEIVSDGIAIKKSNLTTLGDLWSDPKTEWKNLTPEFKERLSEFKQITEALPSRQFKGILRPYQQHGVNWLSYLHTYNLHGLLADDMGLGKTVQVIAFLSRLDLKKPVLVVVPTSLLFNWEREIEHFLPGTKVYRHHGNNRQQNLPNEGIILTSYTTLRLEQALFMHADWECLILDEAQVMKNPNTQIAQTLYKIPSKMRLSITGTPIENHPIELWSHFHFLLPELLGPYKDFEAALQSSQVDSRHLKAIRKRLLPFILRRKKEDVAKDLPERIDQLVWIQLSPEQREVYEHFLSGYRGGLLKKVKTEGANTHRMEVLEAILRLRQICCHPLLVQEDQAGSSKLETLTDELETLIEENRKALVYSQFTSMLQIIAKELKQRNIPYLYLDGSTTNREEIVSQFQNDPQIPVFLISLKAGGVGLNLTAADLVYIFDPWWNDAAEDQAINRAHRIGRKETVIAKKYVAIETIEEKILKLKSAKTHMGQSLLEGEWEATQLTTEDLIFLLT